MAFPASSSQGHTQMGFAQAGATLVGAGRTGALEPGAWYSGAEVPAVGAGLGAVSPQGRSYESQSSTPAPSSQGHSTSLYPTGSSGSHSHGSHGQRASTSPSSPYGVTPPSSYARQQLAASSSRQPPSRSHSQKTPRLSPHIPPQNSSQRQDPDSTNTGRSLPPSPSLGFFSFGRHDSARASSTSISAAQTQFSPSTLPDPIATWSPERRSSLLNPPVPVGWGDVAASFGPSSTPGQGWRPVRAQPIPSPNSSTHSDGSDDGDGHGFGEAEGRTGLLRPGLAVLLPPTHSTRTPIGTPMESGAASVTTSITMTSSSEGEDGHGMDDQDASLVPRARSPL
ncbi:hypothetical protein B0H19DRAFT_1160135 [Mycena capillaripes]|nr:hypothetical protein B0H19DRAFT_1160135 [Mycena capillaripes]